MSTCASASARPSPDLGGHDLPAVLWPAQAQPVPAVGGTLRHERASACAFTLKGAHVRGDDGSCKRRSYTTVPPLLVRAPCALLKAPIGRWRPYRESNPTTAPIDKSAVTNPGQVSAGRYESRLSTRCTASLLVDDCLAALCVCVSLHAAADASMLRHCYLRITRQLRTS